MPNRVIKDSIWSSPTLAKLPLDTQLHWPRWLLMADDWGCFNADPDVIKGLVYPKIQTITIRKICDLLKSYTEAGLLFLWNTGERMWGFFTSWNGHQFCNATHLSEDGKQLRHQRKTPEPPENELSAYLAHHNQITQVVSGNLEQVRAVQKKYRNPNPNPNPNPRNYSCPEESTSVDLVTTNGSCPPEWQPVKDHLHTLTWLNKPELYNWEFWKHLDTSLSAFPDLSVVDELSKAEAWLMANPRKASTKKRWKAFVLNWFHTAAERRARYEKGQR